MPFTLCDNTGLVEPCKKAGGPTLRTRQLHRASCITEASARFQGCRGPQHGPGVAGQLLRQRRPPGPPQTKLAEGTHKPQVDILQVLCGIYTEAHADKGPLLSEPEKQAWD